MKPIVLVAVAEPTMSWLCRLYLQERGYEVETAGDALECLAKLRRGKPTVLVLDLDLRWGGGDGVLAWLREEGGAPSVPVVLVVPASFQRSEDLAAPPVVSRLQQPLVPEQLLRRICTLVKEETAARNGHRQIAH